jgi:hypothetical protein
MARDSTLVEPFRAWPYIGAEQSIADLIDMEFATGVIIHMLKPQARVDRASHPREAERKLGDVDRECPREIGDIGE